MEDPLSVLHELSERAAKYTLNLNGRVNRTLGRNPCRGGTASVYHGTLAPNSIEVAIKTLRSAPPGEVAALKRILREVHLRSKLRHDNIVPLLGISTEFDLTISMISEWMPLGNAHTYVQNTENDPRPLLQDVASGLYYLHTHTLGPVVHGDVKGTNVLVSGDRRALLTDFGFSIPNESSFTVSVEATRGISLHWTAPEVLDDCATSTASDVWSFGMTILELVTRRVPFHDCRVPSTVISRLLTGKLPPRPAEESTQFRLSDAWWEICISCWGRSPASRPTIKDIIEKVAAIQYPTAATLLPQPTSPVRQEFLISSPTHQQATKLPSALQWLPSRASAYGILLNGRISRNSGKKPLRGSTAIVYQGTLAPCGTKVAIKAFHSRAPASEAELKRIFREVHVWSKLRHKNIVSMLGISTEFDSTVSIISEWVPLGNACIYVQDTKNDPRPLLRDIASGLHYLHSHASGPVVHGDLKGLNVLVSSDRRALLADFGLSTLNISAFNLTLDAVRGGSFRWMAPELLDDFPVSTASDVWAYGMTVLELFTRGLPFRECFRSGNVCGRLMMERLPSRPTGDSTQFRLTNGWWDVCTSCWAGSPSLRPTMKDIIEKVQDRNFEGAGNDTVTGQVSESTALMNTTLEYSASAADANLDYKCTSSAPPIADENNSVNTNHSNVKQALPPTGFPPGLESRAPFVPTLEDGSRGVEEALTGDIIIAIIGAIGSGKSSFIDKIAAAGTGQGVEHHLTAHTSGVQVTRCTFERSRIILVDTPGFDDTRMSDLDVLNMVFRWLNTEYQKGTRLAAILWFHSITDKRTVGFPPRNLQVFGKLCGKFAIPKVVLVTTMWDKVDEDVGEERLKALKDTYWKMMISEGSKISKYRNTRESATQLIRSIVHRHQDATQKGVQLQEETSVLESELQGKVSGRKLCSRLGQLAEKRMGTQTNEADKKIPRDTQREHADVEAQLNSTLVRARASSSAFKGKHPRKFVRKLWKFLTSARETVV